MPKAKRIRAAALTRQAVRQEPLGQILQKNDDTMQRQYATQSVRALTRQAKQHHQHQVEEKELGILDVKASHKILQLSKAQRLEMEMEEEIQQQQLLLRQRQQQHPISRRSLAKNDDDSSDEDDDEDDLQRNAIGDDDLVQHDGGYVTVMDDADGLTAEEEALVASMMKPSSSSDRRSLADIILEKIDEKKQQQQRTSEPGQSRNDPDDSDAALPDKVVQVYTEIGKILSRYTAGKLPKAFKVIPALSNWEQVLYLTRPDLWTPQAMFAATRIFASNLNPKMAQRFYHLVLLDSVRADIANNKRLNYHYYMALKKSVYKPAAFFKGILLPIARDPTCTLREAAIVASVLQRVSIPVHHAAVALHKLALQEHYSGAASIFIKTLLNKKYSLPAPVIASLVQHFASFAAGGDHAHHVTLPVLWHQALLVFVQRYKHQLQENEHTRNRLRIVVKRHFHAKITPEIRRELFGIQAWKDERSSHGGTMATSTGNKGIAGIQLGIQDDDMDNDDGDGSDMLMEQE